MEDKIPIPPPPPIIWTSDPVECPNNHADLPFSLESVRFHPTYSDGIFINNCPSVNDAVTMLTKEWLVNIFNRFRMLFMIKVVINSWIRTLSTDEIVRLMNTYNNQSLMISFGNNVSGNQVYWKFYCSKIFAMKIPAIISDFVLKFLSDSMSNDSTVGVSTKYLRTLNSSDPVCELQLQHIADSRDRNLLMTAAEIGDESAVDYLLESGFNVNESVSEQMAIDVAWNARHYRIVTKLLMANSMYPKNFEVYQAPLEIKNFHSQSQQLHENIKAGREEEILEILTSAMNLSLKYYFTSENVSAVATALKSEKFDMYKILLDHEICVGPAEDVDEIIKNLNVTKRQHIKCDHIQPFCNDPVLKLYANSYIGYDTPASYQQWLTNFVISAYEYLNTIAEFKPILKVVAASRTYKIIFEFYHDSTIPFPISGPHASGSLNFTRQIYVAAKQMLDPETKHIAYGKLMQKLCNYAMYIVYDNNGRPYLDTEDKAPMDSFDEIVVFCKKVASDKNIITMVLENSHPYDQHAELMARVPHIIAENFSNQILLQQYKINYSRLFNHYYKVIVRDMESWIARNGHQVNVGGNHENCIQIVESNPTKVIIPRGRWRSRILDDELCELVAQLSLKKKNVFDDPSI